MSRRDHRGAWTRHVESGGSLNFTRSTAPQPSKQKRAPTSINGKRESKLERELANQLWLEGLECEREYRFCERRWRLDFAWPDERVAVELQGGIFTEGRHSRGQGMLNDMEKLNCAQKMGWTVLLFGPPHVRLGTASLEIKNLIFARRGLVDLVTSEQFNQEHEPRKRIKRGS